MPHYCCSCCFGCSSYCCCSCCCCCWLCLFVVLQLVRFVCFLLMMSLFMCVVALFVACRWTRFGNLLLYISKTKTHQTPNRGRGMCWWRGNNKKSEQRALNNYQTTSGAPREDIRRLSILPERASYSPQLQPILIIVINAVVQKMLSSHF